MVSKHNKWLRKIQEWFLGKEETYTVEPTKQKPHYGRLEADDRPSELKVVHKYPKQGKFRFPVIEDQPKVIRQKKDESKLKQEEQTDQLDQSTQTKPARVVTTYQGSREENETPTEKKRDFFTNSQFKPTFIPSPVYGFKKREEKKANSLLDHVHINDSGYRNKSSSPLEKYSDRDWASTSKEPHLGVQHEIAVTAEEKIKSDDSAYLEEDKITQENKYYSEDVTLLRHSIVLQPSNQRKDDQEFESERSELGFGQETLEKTTEVVPYQEQEESIHQAHEQELEEFRREELRQQELEEARREELRQQELEEARREELRQQEL
ncbi:hypothetical protein, partial [Alkalihalobacterium elongatum]|uniref:hypothetical protein n=1 Tax=Alkalihalobacterium elongatum TaxID=2675466 RepID=UPI001C1FFFDC